MVRKMQRDNYIVVQGWMVTDLKLSGNELLVYAIIYGFSQCGDEQKYTGSIRYLTEWTNTTRQTIMNCLKSLCDKGLISKEEHLQNGVKFCDYRAEFDGGSKNFTGGGQKILPGGGKNILPHKIDPKIKAENKDLYSPDPELNQAIKDFLDYRKKLKKPMTERAVKQFMSRLEELSPGDAQGQIGLINTALEHGWMTVYPAKDDKPRKQTYGQQRGTDYDALMGALYGQ